MIENIWAREKLLGVARVKKKLVETKSINPSLLSDFQEKGWTQDKKQKRSLRISKPKAHGVLLEDRVWSLFYNMGFEFLSGKGGATLSIDSNVTDGPKNQLDVVCIDNEVSLAIECKSSENYSSRPKFQEELGKFNLIRENFIKAVREGFPVEHKRQIVTAMFLSKIQISENDRERAKQCNILLFDENDLYYYEQLSQHLGFAAKYQILADLLQGKSIPGLTIKIPAVKTKMGGSYCYAFSITPDYLLKISYVSHRSKGKASDINAYQRMLAKSRLRKIKEYIENDGIFPTNIVLSLEKNRLLFQKIKQETDDTTESGILGWLEIKAAYKSAWVIDGQHRLFAYSGHRKSKTSKLSVLAFEGLLPSKQAELFIDINAKQKSVKLSLLQELYAELHWDSEEPSVRIRAIISKSIQDLNVLKDSPLFGRIQTSDSQKDALKCITLTTVFGQIEKKGFHIIKEKAGEIVQYGPLWDKTNDRTLKRTVFILKNWFNEIAKKNKEWWDKGSSEGGGLAMNDGIATFINVLRSVFEHLGKSKDLIKLDNEDLWTTLRPFAIGLSDYLSEFDEKQKQFFRDLRGIQGVTTRTRRCQLGIQQRIEKFNPDGLEEFIRLEKAQTNEKAKKLIDDIEVTLQTVIIEMLKEEFSEDESGWWTQGVPKPIRLSVTQKFEEDDGKRGGKEFYFDLIHYKKIIEENWDLFQDTFLLDKKVKKDKRTSWLDFINEKRKLVAHASSGVNISLEDLSKIETYSQLLHQNIRGAGEENAGGENNSEAAS